MPKADGAVELLQHALNQGCNVVLSLAAPPHVDHTVPLVSACMLKFTLRRAEARLLAHLLQHGRATKAELYAATTGTGVPDKNVGVVFSRLRKRLRPYGVEIVTLHGVGYALAAGASDKLHKLLSEHGVGIRPPAEPAVAPPD